MTDNRRKDYLEICIPLYEASMTGNWPHAKTILEEHPEVIRSSITENYETALHVASSAKNTHFVENLVKMMTKEDLELQNKNLNTALSLAAAAGTVDIAKLMVERNKGLLTIPGSQGMMPLYMAALFGNSEMVKYLYSKSQKLHDDGWTQQNRGWLLVKCVESDLFGKYKLISLICIISLLLLLLLIRVIIKSFSDVALDILKDYPELGDDGQVLQVLARKPDAFTRKDPKFIRRFYHKSIYSTPCCLYAKKKYVIINILCYHLIIFYSVSSLWSTW